MIIVTPFFMSGALFTAEQLANGFVASVVLLVGLGTVIHSMLDYSISILVWKPLGRPQTIEPQTFTSFARDGFTVVEWGGCEVK